MATIKVNGKVNGLVHKGGTWISTATLPDVCKTPTPGGPVPMPYPNVSQQSTLSKGTKVVKVDGGNMAAIKGSKYAMSTGDEPGTLGGIKSNTFKRASTWITYSFDVKIEGKNACRFTDKKFQNNENTIDAGGVLPMIVPSKQLDPVAMKCGELNQFGEQSKDRSQKGKYHRDHVPSKAALLKRAEQLAQGRNKNPVILSKCQRDRITQGALSIVIPAPVHRNFSRTFAGRGRVAAPGDRGDLAGAARKDLAEVKKGLRNIDPACVKAYEKSAEKVRKITNKQYDAWLRKMLKCP